MYIYILCIYIYIVYIYYEYIYIYINYEYIYIQGRSIQTKHAKTFPSSTVSAFSVPGRIDPMALITSHNHSAPSGVDLMSTGVSISSNWKIAPGPPCKSSTEC